MIYRKFLVTEANVPQNPGSLRPEIPLFSMFGSGQVALQRTAINTLAEFKPPSSYPVGGNLTPTVATYPCMDG